MSFNVISSKLTGNPGEGGWAQVHDFRPEDEEKRNLRGHLFAVCATKEGKQGLDTVFLGREMLTRFHEEYFGKIKTSAFSALKDAVEKVIEEFEKVWGDVEVSAVSVLGDIVYSAAGGGAQVAIFRRGMFAKILVSKRRNSTDEKTELVCASGYPEDEDILILGTNSFFNTYLEGTLKAALDGKDPRAAVELLAPTAHSQKDKGDLGTVFLKFEKKKPLFDEYENKEVSGPLEEEKRKRYRKKVFNLLKESYESFRGKIKKALLSRLAKIPERKIYVKETEEELETSQNRRLAASIGVILLLLLVVSIGFGIKQKRTKEERLRYESRLLEAKHEFDEAVSLLSLDATRARELFIESRKKANQLLEEGVSDPILEELKKSLDENQGMVLGEYTQKADFFVDLSLLSDGFVGDDLASSLDSIFVLDIKGEKVAEVMIDTSRAKIVAGPDEIEKARSIAAYVDRAFVVNKDNVYEIGKGKVIEIDWVGEVLLYAYAGNIYVLEKEKSIIWRFPAIEEGFVSGKSWLSQGTQPDLSDIVSWTIDGTIWLLDSQGGVSKYSYGNKQPFTISGVNPPLIKPVIIYTNEELGFLYVLDKEEGRIVVLEKSGEYKAQYFSEEIKKANDLAVSEEFEKIILLTGEKLYSIEIKHLGE